MTLARIITRLAAAALLVGAASSAFARDTRADTEPTRIEHGGGDSEVDNPVMAKLPRGAEGTSCVVGNLNGVEGFYVALENETGKVIPKGTVITLYVQPGNIQKLLKLNFDWKPGVDLSYDFFGDASLVLPAECSFKLSPGRGPAEPKFKVPAEDSPVPLPPGDDDLVPDPADFACWVEVDENGLRTVHLKNISDTAYPPGTTIAVTFDNGKTFHATWVGYFGDGSTKVDPLPNEAYWGTPETCTVEVRIPD